LGVKLVNVGQGLIEDNLGNALAVLLDPPL
jgi:hypothetical protein